MSSRSLRLLIPAAAAALVAGVVGVPAAQSAPAAAKCAPAPRANCAGANLRGANLAGRNLRGINLRGADLTGANLRGADLRDANLVNAELVNADLRKVDFHGADLRRADFGHANLHSTVFAGATLNADDQAVLVLPQDGQKMIDLLDTATQSVDIVIYEIGGPLWVGQPDAPGALMDAVSRGIKVRITVNGNWFSSNPGCSYDDTTKSFTNQHSCAVAGASWMYAVQNSLDYAYAHPNAGVTPIAPELRFANNNFQITHQKTVLIDATYPTGANAGQPRPANDQLPTSMVIVSTGNLQSEYWGSSYKQTTDAWMTNPASTCGKPNPPYQPAAGTTGCQVESAARDFAVPVTDDAMVASVASVFYSDFFCGAAAPSTSPSDANTNGLLTTTLPLTWSNGSLQGKVGSTPKFYPSPVYGYSSSTKYASSTQEGNVRGRQMALIQGAKTSLSVYNEEMADDSIIDALAAKAKAGLNVKVVMTYGWSKYDDTINYYDAFSELAAAGASIVLTQVPEKGVNAAAELYIHAKAIIADGTDLWVGSTNIGTSSMDFNRELGLMVTSRENAGGVQSGWVYSPQVVGGIVTTFNGDFADTKNGTPWSTVVGTPASVLRRGVVHPEERALQPRYSPTYPILCGPLPATDTPVPAP